MIPSTPSSTTTTAPHPGTPCLVTPPPPPPATGSSLATSPPRGDPAPEAERLARGWPVPRAASLTRPGLSAVTPACPLRWCPRRGPGLFAVARVLLVTGGRLLAGLVVAAFRHRLRPAAGSRPACTRAGRRA